MNPDAKGLYSKDTTKAAGQGFKPGSHGFTMDSP